VFKTKEERMKHADQVRNEGLMQKKTEDANSEIDLEIEAPGSANSVAEEGAKTIQSADEFQNDVKTLAAARKKPENKLGKGGFQIELKDPKTFENSMAIVLLDNPEDENSIKVEKFDSSDANQSKQASMAMALAL
jgi:hypothetical protein